MNLNPNFVTYCLRLEKLVKLSESEFILLQRSNASTYLMRLFWKIETVFS